MQWAWRSLEEWLQNSYNELALPTEGKPVEYNDGKLIVPDNPIIPFIEGDGTGRDIWRASQRVFDAAVEKAYGGKRQVAWYEIFAGEKAFQQFKTWLPEDTVNARARSAGLDQRTADHSGWRRHSFAQCGYAAGA